MATVPGRQKGYGSIGGVVLGGAGADLGAGRHSASACPAEVLVLIEWLKTYGVSYSGAHMPTTCAPSCAPVHATTTCHVVMATTATTWHEDEAWTIRPSKESASWTPITVLVPAVALVLG